MPCLARLRGVPSCSLHIQSLKEMFASFSLWLTNLPIFPSYPTSSLSEGNSTFHQAKFRPPSSRTQHQSGDSTTVYRLKHCAFPEHRTPSNIKSPPSSPANAIRHKTGASHTRRVYRPPRVLPTTHLQLEPTTPRNLLSNIRNDREKETGSTRS